MFWKVLNTSFLISLVSSRQKNLETHERVGHRNRCHINRKDKWAPTIILRIIRTNVLKDKRKIYVGIILPKWLILEMKSCRKEQALRYEY
ncbi:hypothetical protein CN689_00455 [Peribacillus butanolivorans]|uniref:Secreted protein n=1 Tax=Peribacillus butanolivorans TaxID=421767 RepID=A0AAX0S914_9BACI|nr:hypothetical protein CN689_00455 [Peribacillus butanolivorans]